MNKLNLPKERKFLAPGSIWKRTLALIIDLIVINFVIVSHFNSYLQNIIPSKSYLQATQFITNSPEIMKTLTSVMIIIAILSLLYFTLLKWKIHQTIGMIILNLHIKSENKNISFWQVLVSNLTFIPFFPFVLLWVIDPMHMFYSPKNQRFMEKIVGLLTVEEYRLK